MSCIIYIVCRCSLTGERTGPVHFFDLSPYNGSVVSELHLIPVDFVDPFWPSLTEILEGTVLRFEIVVDAASTLEGGSAL